jgi:Flp pilus assembly protein TadG
MTVFRKLVRDQRGAGVVEFAIALPVLVTMIWGVFQIGLVMQANAGMQHALGEAARFATVWPTPSDSAIQARVTSRKFGTYNGSLGTLSISNNTTGSGPTLQVVSKDLTLQYTHTMRFMFLPSRNVTLTRTKRVYLAS